MGIEKILQIDTEIDLALGSHTSDANILRKLYRKRNIAIKRLHGMDPRYKVHGINKHGRVANKYATDYKIEKAVVEMLELLRKDT